MSSISVLVFLIHYILDSESKFKRVLRCKQVILQHIIILLYQRTKHKAYLFIRTFRTSNWYGKLWVNF